VKLFFAGIPELLYLQTSKEVKERMPKAKGTVYFKEILSELNFSVII
jgi:hypothetical protein